MNRIVQYQIGVDVLGFPIYLQHEVYQDKPATQKKYDDPKKYWVTVIAKFFKQH